MSTNIAIELPDDIARALREKWGDLSQHTIEALAAEGYRTRALSGAQVQRMLGLETRLEVDVEKAEHDWFLVAGQRVLEPTLSKLTSLDLAVAPNVRLHDFELAAEQASGDRFCVPVVGLCVGKAFE